MKVGKMMKTLKFFTFVIALFCSTLSSANAQAGTSTNDLLDVCLSAAEGDNTACRMYISGVIQGMEWGFNMAAFRSGFTEGQAMQEANTLMGACIPQAANGGQTYEVALQYMRNNPQSWHEPPVMVIHKALMEAFPCE